MSAGLTCDFVVTFKPMVSYERVRFGGMRDAGCGMRDDRCSGGMLDKSSFEQQKRDLLILIFGMRDSYKTDGGMRYQKQKLTLC